VAQAKFLGRSTRAKHNHFRLELSGNQYSLRYPPQLMRRIPPGDMTPILNIQIAAVHEHAGFSSQWIFPE
jgi:hypothetical protein